MNCYNRSLKTFICVEPRPRQTKKIYYQRLSIPISELENKRQFKVNWMSREGEKEIVLYPNRFFFHTIQLC